MVAGFSHFRERHMPNLPFSLAAILFGLAQIATAVFFIVTLPKQDDLWKRVPRERIVGGIVGVICLIWSASLAAPLLEGSLERFRAMLPWIVLGLSVSSFLLLDYLFARAMGGLILLAVNSLLHGAFVAHMPARPLFSLICYLLGTYALFMLGSPYRFRDLLERMTLKSGWRFGVGGTLLAAGLFTCATAAMAHGG
jgi:hypothetical protein